MPRLFFISFKVLIKITTHFYNTKKLFLENYIKFLNNFCDIFIINRILKKSFYIYINMTEENPFLELNTANDPYNN